jgi:hypothetical protein
VCAALRWVQCSVACLVVHALCQWLAPGCVPAFSSDGLMHSFTALTAHWGSGQVQPPGKRVWQVAANLLYAQVVKQYRRRKLTYVVRRLLLGTPAAWEAAPRAARKALMLWWIVGAGVW